MKIFSKKIIIDFLKKELAKNNGQAPSHSYFKYHRPKNSPSISTINAYFGNYTKALKAAGYKGHMKGKFNIDENFFEKINNEAKAYFFGLIITDGHLGKKNSHHKNTLSILLIEDDRHILEELCRRLKTKVKLMFRQIKHIYPNRRDIVRFERSNKKIAADLRKHNIGQQKTFIVKYPSRKTLIPKLDRHFLRGVFDGDGNVDKTGRVDITSASKVFLTQILSVLEKNLKIKKNCIIELRKGSTTTYRLRINCGKKQFVSKKIYKYFYDNCDPKLYLKRKHLSFKQRLKYL